MTTKFLTTAGGQQDLSDGTAVIFAASLSAVNLSISQPLRTSASKILVSGNLQISEVTNLQTTLDTKLSSTDVKTTGFKDKSELNVTFTETGPDRTIHLTPTVTNFTIYVNGTKYTKTTETLQISNTDGTHLIYYDSSGTLQEIVAPTLSQRYDTVKDNALVGTVGWNSAGAVGHKAVFFSGNNGPQGVIMDNDTKSYKYVCDGAKWLSGGVLDTFVVDGDGSLETHHRYDVNSIELLSQDIQISISAIAGATGLPVLWIGAAFAVNRDFTSGQSVKTTGSGRLAYNSGGSIVECTDSYFVFYHCYATTSDVYPVLCFMGTAQYSTVILARAAAVSEMTALNSVFPLYVLTPLGSILYQTDDTYSNTVKARVISISGTEDYKDMRGTKLSQQVPVLTHGTLVGLEGDSHQQYCLLDGRSGDTFLVDNIGEFTGSGGTTMNHFIKALGGFQDTNVTSSINLGSASATVLNSTFVASSLLGAINENKQTFNDMSEPSGMINTTDQTSTFTNGTRTFEIDATGSTFSFYTQGQIWTKSSADSVVIDDTEGVHMIYYDNTGTLVKIANPTDAQIGTAITTGALVGWIYWDATNNLQLYFTGDNEYHGIQMSSATHAFLHETLGTQYISGSALSSILADQDASLDSHAQFAVDLGSIRDEDLTTSLAAIGSTTGLPVYYKSGASGDWRRTISAGFSILTTGTGRMAWNEDVAGTWQQTEVGNNNFALAHVYSTNDSTYPYITVMGQATYNTVGQARTGATDEINSLILSGMPFAEFVPIASVIFQTSTGYGNAVKSRIRTTDTGDDYVDFRFSGISPSSASPSSHSNLSSLNSDDHFQYCLLNGRTGDTFLVDNIGEFTGSAGVTFNHIPKTAVAPSVGNDICNKTYVDSVGGSGYWNRVGVVLSPATSGDSLSIDEINEQTAEAGVTIEGVVLENGSGTFQNVVSGSTVVNVNANTSGNSIVTLRREGATNDSYVNYNDGATTKWQFGINSSTIDFKFYNASTASNAMTIDIGDNTVGIPNTLITDTINEFTTDTGVTVEGVTLENGSGTFQNTSAGSSLVRINANAAGNSTIFLRREGVANNSYVTFTESATEIWNMGMSDSSQSFYLWYAPGSPDKAIQVADDGRIFFPASYGDTVGGTNKDLYIDDTGLIGELSSILASKMNISIVTDASTLYSLIPKKFQYREKDPNNEGQYLGTPDGPWNFGFVAEDVELVDKTLCLWDDQVNEIGLRGIRNRQILPLAVKCIKDQKATIDTLLVEINDLKNRVTALEQV